MKMDLQQIKYAVSALAIVQMVVAVTAIVLTVKNIILGIREKDSSKYRRAGLVFLIALGSILLIGVIQFFILLK